MVNVTIAPLWTIRHSDGRVLGPRVVELLVKIDEHGSLARACTAAGASYRHAWQLLREGESLFGQPLLVMSRGRGSQLTALGERLVWAQRRIQARLAPSLDSLASELSAEIARTLSVAPARLRIHASHGFAVQALHDIMGRTEVAHELKYCDSAEALSSLSSGLCEVAGLHIPLGQFEDVAVEHYRPWFDLRKHRVIELATRRQGLMVAAGNPKGIYEVNDLLRPDVRFINRQPGSGTRYLLDLMLDSRGIAGASIRGYEQCEFTHAAVAAFVASGMADAGLGVEVPAREFKLEFLPAQRERYFLLCDERNLETSGVRHLLEVLRSAEYRAVVDRLPGYDAGAAGTVATLEAAFKAMGKFAGKPVAPKQPKSNGQPKIPRQSTNRRARSAR